MLRGFILGIVVTIVVAVVGGYIAIQSGAFPARADARPGGIETWIAQTALTAAVQREAPKGPIPVPFTDGNLVEGVRLYATRCAFCHGTSEGDASATPIAKGEYPRPPQFATDGVEDDPEGFTWWKVKHGIRLTGMPSWSGPLSDQQIWTLALFLKHMDKLPPKADAAWKQVKNTG
jgi:mono/diheme cytochrome c family protein